jgi:hypothetical protein
MKKIQILLFLLLPFLGVSQENDVLTQQSCILVEIMSLKEQHWVTVDFIENYDKHLNIINSSTQLTTFEITSTELYDLNCNQIDYVTFFLKKQQLLNNIFLCSSYNSVLLSFIPIECVGE